MQTGPIGSIPFETQSLDIRSHEIQCLYECITKKFSILSFYSTVTFKRLEQTCIDLNLTLYGLHRRQRNTYGAVKSLFMN